MILFCTPTPEVKPPICVERARERRPHRVRLRGLTGGSECSVFVEKLQGPQFGVRLKVSVSEGSAVSVV